MGWEWGYTSCAWPHVPSASRPALFSKWAEHQAASLGLLGGLLAAEVEVEAESPSRHLGQSAADRVFALG